VEKKSRLQGYSQYRRGCFGNPGDVKENKGDVAI